MYVHTMPVVVGSAVEVRKTSTSPRYMRARRSYCRPREVTVKLIWTVSKSQVGGMYSPKNPHRSDTALGVINGITEGTLTDKRFPIARTKNMIHEQDFQVTSISSLRSK